MDTIFKASSDFSGTGNVTEAEAQIESIKRFMERKISFMELIDVMKLSFSLVVIVKLSILKTTEILNFSNCERSTVETTLIYSR